MRDPHKLLGVSENASEDEIRCSYRKLVRKHHPDLNPDDPKAEERFKELQQAYEALTKPGRRGGFGRASRQRTSGPRPKPRRRTGGRVEFSGDLSDLLKKLGYQPRNRASGGAGHLREMREEDVARILKRFGIDAARASKIRVSFGDAADWNRRSPGENKDPSEMPPINEDLKRPPKPPKPPKW